jgi:hypothetical protein
MHEPAPPDVAFAGELFRALAAQGRLVVDADVADALISGLQQSLDVLTAQVRLVRMWHTMASPRLDGLPAPAASSVVDAVFTDQLAPGHLERAVAELPKYIDALRLARRPASPA